MDTPDKEKLFAYSVKMLNRGDSLSDIVYYLDCKGADAELKKEIILKLDEHKKNLQCTEKKYYPVSLLKIVVGVVFFVLTVYLVHLGIIAFPVSLLGFAVAGVTIFEIVKLILNYFK